jgi:hypothetical protein
MTKNKLPHIPISWQSAGGNRFTLRPRHYNLNEIIDEKGTNFHDFFTIDKIQDSSDLVKEVYRNEDLVNSIIKKSDLIRKYTNEDSLSYVREYSEEVSEDLKVIQQYTENLTVVFDEMEDSYNQLKTLFVKILEYEDIDLSKYSSYFTEKDRSLQIRKRKIDSILDEDSDEES